jgi:hypothetical protein
MLWFLKYVYLEFNSIGLFQNSRSRMRAALLHIGDSSDNLESQLERLVASMERDLISHAEFMVDIILQGSGLMFYHATSVGSCFQSSAHFRVMFLPGRAAIFASLTAQFTAAEPSFITMMVSSNQSGFLNIQIFL